jgi:hypothetical protein
MSEREHVLYSEKGSCGGGGGVGGSDGSPFLVQCCVQGLSDNMHSLNNSTKHIITEAEEITSWKRVHLSVTRTGTLATEAACTV